AAIVGPTKLRIYLDRPAVVRNRAIQVAFDSVFKSAIRIGLHKCGIGRNRPAVVCKGGIRVASSTVGMATVVVKDRKVTPVICAGRNLAGAGKDRRVAAFRFLALLKIV